MGRLSLELLRGALAKGEGKLPFDHAISRACQIGRFGISETPPGVNHPLAATRHHDLGCAGMRNS